MAVIKLEDIKSSFFSGFLHGLMKSKRILAAFRIPASECDEIINYAKNVFGKNYDVRLGLRTVGNNGVILNEPNYLSIYNKREK